MRWIASNREEGLRRALEDVTHCNALVRRLRLREGSEGALSSTSPREKASIDDELGAYATSASGLTQSRAGRIPMIGAHTIAVGAALTMAPSAEAAPVYSGLRNTTLNGAAGTYMFDIDGSGFAEGRLSTGSFDFGFVNAAFARAYMGLSSPNRMVVSAGNLVRFSSGDSIGLPSQFVSDVGRFRSIYSFPYVSNVSTRGQFPGPPGDDFFGVRFQRAGNFHWAWLRVVVDPSGQSITLVDWAWESDPNTPIQAGAGALAAVPEPASSALVGLGLLALGARGVRRLRDRVRTWRASPARRTAEGTHSRR